MCRDSVEAMIESSLKGEDAEVNGNEDQESAGTPIKKFS